MGGGDLNLKKDWHTQKLSNIEKVWQAEQRVEEQKRRYEQRQKELKEERERMDLIRMQEEAGLIKKRGERLDWMYNGAESEHILAEEREAYLLGRKRVDRIEEPNHPDDGGIASGAAWSFTGISAENEARDVMTKVREDPLFAIKMNEKKALEAAMMNPSRLKMLQRMPTGTTAQRQQHQEHHIENKSRRHHHDRNDRDRDTYKRSRSRSRNRRRSRSRDRRQSRSRSHERNERNRSRSRERKVYRSRDRYNETRDRRQSRERPARHEPRVNDVSRPRASAISKEERQRRLEEMQSNARQMLEERKQRVASYQASEKREWEEEEHRYRSGNFSKFQNGQNMTLMKAAQEKAHHDIERRKNRH